MSFSKSKNTVNCARPSVRAGLRLGPVDPADGGDRLLDRLDDLPLHRLRGGAGVEDGDPDDRLLDVGELVGVQVEQRGDAERHQRHHRGDGDDRALDREIGDEHQRCASSWRTRTRAPGATPWAEPRSTVSPGVSPDLISTISVTSSRMPSWTGISTTRPSRSRWTDRVGAAAVHRADRHGDGALGIGRHPALGEQPGGVHLLAVGDRGVDPHLPRGRIHHRVDPIDLPGDPAVAAAHGELDRSADLEPIQLVRRHAGLEAQPARIHDGVELGPDLHHVTGIHVPVADDAVERRPHRGCLPAAWTRLRAEPERPPAPLPRWWR